MRIDIINVFQLNPVLFGMVNRHFHCPVSAVAGRRGNVISVAAHAVADNFGINLGTAGLGMFQFFQNQSP